MFELHMYFFKYEKKEQFYTKILYKFLLNGYSVKNILIFCIKFKKWFVK